jgi:glycosyltransferase involved in cell wall biosynthesis
MLEEKNIRLLVATGIYPPDIGGPATYSRMLEETLHNHAIDVTVIPFGKVRHLPKVIRHFAFFLLLLKKVWHADIVYALDPMSVGVPARVVAFLARKKFIIRLGGDYAWEQGQQRFGVTQTLDEYTHNPQKNAWQVRLLAYIQTRIVKSAQFVILPSEYLKSIVQTWGIDDEKIRVIYSALFPLDVVGSKEVIRQQLSYEGVVIVSVGRLVPWKGFDTLIEAIAILKNDIPDISLVIIGDGPLQNTLLTKIQECHVEGRVRLVGRLSKDALGAAIKGADVFVLNTSYEGLSHQLLEVMDIGVPIVTTNIGGNPELITDGISGTLVEAGDTEALTKAIQHIVLNEPTRLRLTQNARLRTQDFTEEAVVTAFASFLHTEVFSNDKKI